MVESLQCKSILISGAGIAGPTVAYWLLHHGFEPTIVERAPAFREGGYIIDFWGIGFDVAEKMGLLPELRKRGYRANKVTILDSGGKKVGGFRTDILYANLKDRVLSIQRCDLASVIFEKIKSRVDVVFGDSITKLYEANEKVLVSFQNSPDRTFDLVIGADGLHSQVRKIAFGTHDRFVKNLGYHAAAFSVDNYRPRDPDSYTFYSVPRKQLARFALRDNRTVFFLIFSDKCLEQFRNIHSLSDSEKLDRIFRGMCIESDTALDAMHSSNDLYYDAVSQIRMPKWSQGRIALLGDAAASPSLLAGQGASLAMASAYILAGELRKANGDHSVAFKEYEDEMKGFIAQKQINAEKFGEWFAPDTKFQILIRNEITKLFAVPFIASRFVGNSLSDQKELPEY